MQLKDYLKVFFDIVIIFDICSQIHLIVNNKQLSV